MIKKRWKQQVAVYRRWMDGIAALGKTALEPASAGIANGASRSAPIDSVAAGAMSRVWSVDRIVQTAIGVYLIYSCTVRPLWGGAMADA